MSLQELLRLFGPQCGFPRGSAHRLRRRRLRRRVLPLRSGTVCTRARRSRQPSLWVLSMAPNMPAVYARFVFLPLDDDRGRVDNINLFDRSRRARKQL